MIEALARDAQVLSEPSLAASRHTAYSPCEVRVPLIPLKFGVSGHVRILTGYNPLSLLLTLRPAEGKADQHKGKYDH